MSFTTSYHSSQQSVLMTFSCLGRLFHAVFGGIPKSCEDAPFDTARLMAAGWDTVCWAARCHNVCGKPEIIAIHDPPFFKMFREDSKMPKTTWRYDLGYGIYHIVPESCCLMWDVDVDWHGKGQGVSKTPFFHGLVTWREIQWLWYLCSLMEGPSKNVK